MTQYENFQKIHFFLLYVGKVRVTNISHVLRVLFAKPTNMKLGLYIPLSVPLGSGESICMNYFLLYPRQSTTMTIFAVMDIFLKLATIWLHARKATIHQAYVFNHVWFHFKLPSSLVSDYNPKIFYHFWQSLWKMFYTCITQQYFILERWENVCGQSHIWAVVEHVKHCTTKLLG